MMERGARDAAEALLRAFCNRKVGRVEDALLLKMDLLQDVIFPREGAPGGDPAKLNLNRDDPIFHLDGPRGPKLVFGDF